MATIKVSIVGGSGYTGGELMRLLLFHPHVEICQVTSERNVGKFVFRLHPNLRKVTKLKFCSIEELRACDLLFLCLPHGQAMQKIDHFKTLAPRIIDLSGDFRLKNAQDYCKWYDIEHPQPQMLQKFVYGIPELHRQQMQTANYISSAGCNATAVILALHPLYQEDIVDTASTVVEVKAGTSQAGASVNAGSHHPERSGAIRSYKPFGHRHLAEIIQELSLREPAKVHLTATSIDMVRGLHCVAHVFVKGDVDEKALWKIYRNSYGNEPFMRIVKENAGIHRLPDPKILVGSNYCDIGFAKDPDSKRLIVFSALDNLMKGAAGQALQAFNLMHGMDETLGLTFPGLHPA